MSTDEPQPMSPYGPATDAPSWVDRGRHGLRIAILITGALSLGILLVVLVFAAIGQNVLASADTEFGTNLLWVATLASPVLFVIAMNLLVWRALLVPIARKRRGETIVLVTVTAVGLAVASFAAVVVLLLGGFLVTAVFA